MFFIQVYLILGAIYFVHSLTKEYMNRAIVAMSVSHGISPWISYTVSFLLCLVIWPWYFYLKLFGSKG